MYFAHFCSLLLTLIWRCGSIFPFWTIKPMQWTTFLLCRYGLYSISNLINDFYNSSRNILLAVPLSLFQFEFIVVLKTRTLLAEMSSKLFSIAINYQLNVILQVYLPTYWLNLWLFVSRTLLSWYNVLTRTTLTCLTYIIFHWILAKNF